MKMIRVTNITDVLQIVPHELEMRAKGYDEGSIKDMLSYLMEKLDDPSFYFYLIFYEEEIAGYLYFTIVKKAYEKCIRVEKIWCGEKHMVGVVLKLYKLLKSTAKEHKITRLQIKINRSLIPIAREWGFRQKAVLMENDTLFARRNKYGRIHR